VPIVLEVTSALAAMAAALVVTVALRLAPPTRGPAWRTVAIHLAGSLLYSLTHVGLMALLRVAAFAAAGHHFSWSLAELPYEYRKDVLTYVVMAGIMWFVIRPSAPPAPAPAQGPTGPATFDIRDGATILRIPTAEILAAQAAGNYVEFALADGRRPLMRVSMAKVEAALAAHGFLRTHRSWLVNAERVRGLSAAGSGDFRLDFGAGLTAPLSRRYPDALARLKSGTASGAPEASP
jgi:hypothetical protein